MLYQVHKKTSNGIPVLVVLSPLMEKERLHLGLLLPPPAPRLISPKLCWAMFVGEEAEQGGHLCVHARGVRWPPMFWSPSGSLGLFCYFLNKPAAAAAALLPLLLLAENFLMLLSVCCCPGLVAAIADTVAYSVLLFHTSTWYE